MLAIDGDGHSAASTHKTYSRLHRVRFNGYFNFTTHFYMFWGDADFLRFVHQQHVGDVNNVGLHASGQNSHTFNSTSCMSANKCRGLEDMHCFNDISLFR